MKESGIAGAKWIWSHEDTERLNQHGLFRRRFILPEGHGAVVVHVCADMRYWLYVNGARVTFGPARYAQGQPFYDSVDVTGLARSGDNVIAFLVHSIGPVERCSSFMPLRAGLIASVEWQGGRLVTDASWKAFDERAYAADTPRHSSHQSFIESFDARQAQLGWQRPEFDDSAWGKARVVPTDRATWGPLSPRPVEMLTLNPRWPARLIESGVSEPAPGDDVDDMKTAAQRLAASLRRPSPVVETRPGGTLPLRLRAPQDPRLGAYAVYDFGENSSGYVVFDVEGTPGTVVDVGYGEEFDAGFVGCAVQGVRYNDRFILGDKRMTHQVLMPKTFQYLLIEIRRGAATFHEVRHDVSHYPVQWRGKFCALEQPGLAAAWRAAARTVCLCMEDVYVDTPRRERAGWLGDMAAAAPASYYAFGETRLYRHALDLFMRSQKSDGSIVGRFPSIDGPNMPAFSAAYVIALKDYVLFSGDFHFAGQQWGGVERLLGWFERQWGDDGLFRVTPSKRNPRGPGSHGYILLDWAPARLEGAVTGMNMFCVKCFEDAAFLARGLRMNDKAGRFRDVAAKTRAAVQARMFDARRGVFVNCVDDHGLNPRAGYQENMLALLWDVATPDQARSIARNCLEGRQTLPLWRNSEGSRDWIKLSAGECEWNDEELVPIGSPFFESFALPALFETGWDKLAVATVLSHYGEVLAQGATTIWEDWQGKASRSHGWGAAPVSCAGRYLLGVAPEAPGFARFSVMPCFGPLNEASGWVPTPRGTIEVSWRRTSDGASLRVFMPVGTVAEIGLPSACDADRVALDSVEAPPRRVNLRRGAYAVCEVGPGEHEMRLEARA
ncbi:MAG TPA: family 78 glycoside hydrolase catalytic domain [Candidatus Brocadiia bacterium]|nr:family 78 glycoside hydrolase catalytic domain [Candidatus Brocadiia bacterium]